MSERQRPRRRVSPARLVAYDVLRDVDERDAYANLALPSRIREAELGPRDASLVTELVAGTLRGRGRYDRIIELASARAIAEVDARTRNVLRMGAHQLLSMRVATHAAVNESVELQRMVANANAAGFVNGVLRTISRSTGAQWDAQIEAAAGSADEALAAIQSHPAWIMRALRDALRAEDCGEELGALLAANNAAPRVSIALLPGAGIDAEDAMVRAPDAELQERGPSPLGLELGGGDPSRVIPAFEVPVGFARVQDQGSQLAALALTRARPVERGELWLDLCAGPGGKTAVLGAEALIGGATVRANEVSDHRAELVRRSVVHCESVVEVVSADGREDAAFGGPTALFDRILVDAPCTGLGALRRRPEARWRKRPGDLPGLTKLQGELLDAAAAHLAPGGLIAYVTCSPHLAETRVVVERFLKRHPNMVEHDTRQVLERVARESLALHGTQRSVQLWPHRNGTDAMFIALLGRAEA